VEGLAVSAGDSGHELLKDISLSVKPGEFVCVLGPSGAGKTTLVRTLLGQLTPSKGEILFGSLRVSGDAEILNGLIGYVPQKEIVHDELPVGRALQYAAKLRLPPSLSKQEVAERIHAIETDVGIVHLHDTTVGNLSGGESKRVSLAVELLSFPRILIVDEQNRPMFNSAKADLQPYAKQILREIGQMLNGVPNRVSLSGHTDATPYSTGEKSYSNWELSADRANASRRELIAGGMDETKLLRVVGLSSAALYDRDNPFNPINRRISIIVMNKDAEENVIKDESAVQVTAK
jgi:ABC-type Mn2+/Zn2+ transport system ATPase subunit